MVSRIRPLDVDLVFEDRPYKLGEAIKLGVDLQLNRDVEIREARVDLVCEESYAETFTVMVMDRRATMGGTRHMPPRIPKQVTKEHKETYIHSSVVFLEDARLHSGTSRRFNATLEIQPEPPAHAAAVLGSATGVIGATVKWTLVAAIDVAGARDIKKRQKVTVIFD